MDLKTYPDDLSSEAGVDYTNLRNFLKDGQWREADQETARVMLKAFNRKEGWLIPKDIEKFPCQDLRTIAQLWVKYSNGHFGFSVQKRIFLEVKVTSGKDVWKKFYKRLDWCVNNSWSSRDDLLLSCARERHLPALAWGPLVFGARSVRGGSRLMERLAACDI